VVRRARRPGVRREKGAIERRYTAAPEGSVVVCLDEMGPQAAKGVPGRALLDVTARPARRATREVDYGRRGKGYVFGAFRPTTGEAFTWTATRRTAANFVAFSEQTERRIDPRVGRVYAILDDLGAHRATDVLLFTLAHPRWEFVFQPKYAAYLNLIEPWWKVLRSLALTGKRFETWDEICAAVEAATTYRNAHRHPFHWGRRRRHRPRRQPGVARVPAVA
jgi:transposase